MEEGRREGERREAMKEARKDEGREAIKQAKTFPLGDRTG